MKNFILWILNNYILKKLNASLKKDKYTFVEKWSPIIQELNKTSNKFLEIIKDREITELEAKDFINSISEQIENIFKGF